MNTTKNGCHHCEGCGDSCHIVGCSHECHVSKKDERWKQWVRTLADSSNPRDTDLLIAKIDVLLAAELDKQREEISAEVEELKRTDDTQMNDDHVYDEAISDALAIIRNSPACTEKKIG